MAESVHRDWIITGIYKDEGWSGAVLARLELDRLCDEASKHSIGIARKTKMRAKLENQSGKSYTAQCTGARGIRTLRA